MKTLIYLTLFIFSAIIYSQTPKVLDKRGNAQPTGSCEVSSRYTQISTQPVLWICGSDNTWKKSTITNFTSSCEIIIGDPGTSSPVLSSDNDVPAVCTNTSNSNQEILSVSCYSDTNTPAPTVLPIITGSGSNSILSDNLTCGNKVYNTGTLNGNPFLGPNGTIDANIQTAGGSAKYIIIRIIRRII